MDLKRKFSILVIVLLSSFLFFRIVSWFLADVSYARGRALADAGYLFEAEKSFLRAIRLWPAEPAYHRELAAVYARLAQVSVGEGQKQLLELAGREAERALNLNPQNLLTLKSLAPTYFVLAKVEPALQSRTEALVEQAIGLCPTDPVLWYLRGIVLLGGGERDEAQRSFEEALRLRPNYIKAREAVNALSEL